MIAGLLRRLHYLLRRDRHAADLEEEMRLHMELREDALRQQGMTAPDARAAARRQFGNITRTTEESRDMWGFANVEQLVQDVRFGARRLRQRPGFSIPVIAILALGIGAITAVFSAVDAAMIRGLPFTRPEQLVSLPNVNLPFEARFEPANAQGRLLSITDIAGASDMFSHAAAYASGDVNLADPERPRRVKVGVVTPSFFPTLGVRAAVGRTFNSEEGRPNGPMAVVLSHDLWQSQYGGGDIVGSTVQVHGRSRTVVGIMPPGFNFPRESDIWIPLSVPVTFATFEPFRGFLPSTVIGRLRAGITPEAAAARVLALWQQAVAPATGSRRENLDEFVKEAREDGLAVPLQRQLMGDRRRALLVLLGITALLLLIACANVANLLLSDAAVRRREIAVREVLGASRGRVARQLLGESLMLAMAGALLGIVLAPAALKLLKAMMPASLAGVAPAQLDLRVLAFAVGISVLTSLLFGLWPALGATRGDASAAIKAGSGHGSTASGIGGVRRVLVAAEVGLTVMLLVAAGLMLKSFERILAKESGLRAEQVATMETSFPSTMPRADQQRLVNDLVTALERQQGIQVAGVVNNLPMGSGGGIALTLDVPGAPLKDGEVPMGRMLFASTGYFDAMGIRLLRGRTFTSSDMAPDAPRVAVIGNLMAEKYWPGTDPVGRYFTYRGDDTRITVIGVVADVREYGLHRDPDPQMYQPLSVQMANTVAIVARGTLPPSTLLARMTEVARTVAPTQPVFNVRMMEDVLDNSLAPRRNNTLLIGLFAALALVLAALGVYAVVSYGVAQRTREFGIRAALGARGRDLVTLVSREMIGAIGVGILAGLGAAWAASKVLAALLYEVDARDPMTFAAVPLVLVVPAIIATLIPALRAMRVSPTEVMRAD